MKYLYPLIILLIAALDQWSKKLVEKSFAIGELKEVIPDFFNLTLTYNRGAAFGFLANIENDLIRMILLWGFSTVALVVVIVLLFKSREEEKLFKIGLSMVLGGALGNLIDRWAIGAVVDFLDFYIGNYHWPAFNIADSAICVGVFFVILFSGKKEQAAQAGTADGSVAPAKTAAS